MISHLPSEIFLKIILFLELLPFFEHLTLQSIVPNIPTARVCSKRDSQAILNDFLFGQSILIVIFVFSNFYINRTKCTCWKTKIDMPIRLTACETICCE